MGNTAIDEQRGGSVDVTLGSATVYQGRMPTGPGGVRLYVVRPTVAGSTFRLPNPSYCSVGSEPVCVVINKGTQSIDIASFGGVAITSLAANRSIEAYLGVVGFDYWNLNGPFTVASGSALNGTRKPIELVYTASTTGGTNFRVDAAKQFGYVGADGPVALQVTVKTGVVLGQAAWTGLLFGSPPAGTTTGGWPDGSTCLIVVEPGAYIQGRGGAGGTGMNVAGAGMTAGGAGGTALECLVPTTIVNNGFVRGGGGGGGGGARRTNNSILYVGGSGGGGAGAPGGAGGPLVGGVAGSAGGTGQLESGDAGGNPGVQHAQGGNGGGPGIAGQSGQAGSGGTGNGAAGGAAGYAIRRPTAIAVTQLGSGIYAGGTITF